MTGTRMIAVSKYCCMNLRNHPQSVHTEISKEADDCQCSKQNNRRVATDKAGLETPNERACVDDDLANRMQEPIDYAHVKQFPESFARTNDNRIDNRCVVNLVYVILVFQNPRHL